jgi:signal transduction histidine kinase/ActR/RegA family two-component response regulator
LQRLHRDSVKKQQSGRLITLDAEQTLAKFLVDGWPDRDQFNISVGQFVAEAAASGGPVHAFGEMVALLCAEGKFDAAVHLESLWNELSSQHSFRLFCAYPTRLFASGDHTHTFQRVCSAHSHILPSEHISAHANPQELRLLLATWEQKALALEAEIARRQRAQDQLQDMLRERGELLTQLRDASRAKDGFLAMLGHELRNPLAPIVTALQLMRMRGDTGTEREQAVIQRQVDHLVQLIADLLDISKVARGKIELKKEWIPIADVLTKAVEMASPLFEQRSHRLTVDAQEQLYVNGDGVRLAQIVSNLLSNAARYTPIGGEIHLVARRDAWEHVVISVRDNGIGIAANMVPKIFDLFFQGERSEGGLGIGLALVKSFVELHGGAASVHSDGLGRGSEFTVRIPVAANDASKAPNPRTEITLNVAQSSAKTGLKIVIVDDNIDAAETLAHFLSSSGHEVQVVNSPTAAMSLRTFLPDLAILDIGLPVMDGYELMAQLQQKIEWSNCVFVALTGYGQDLDRERSKVAGFREHFVKPIDPRALLSFTSEIVAAKKTA